MTDREKIDKLLAAGWEVHALVVPDCDKCCPVLRTVLTLESAWAKYEREQAQYPKWACGEGYVWRIESQTRLAQFGSIKPFVCGAVDKTRPRLCTREQAGARLAEILRDPTVAWAGYKARVFVIPSDSRWRWEVWDTVRRDANGPAPTEHAARLAAALWLLDNTLKEIKQ